MSITKQKKRNKTQQTKLKWRKKSIGVGIESVFSRRRIYFFSHSLLTASRSHSFTLTHSHTHTKSNHCISRIHLPQTHSRTCILRWKRIRKILYIGIANSVFTRKRTKKKKKQSNPLARRFDSLDSCWPKTEKTLVGKSLELYTVREKI